MAGQAAGPPSMHRTASAIFNGIMLCRKCRVELPVPSLSRRSLERNRPFPDFFPANLCFDRTGRPGTEAGDDRGCGEAAKKPALTDVGVVSMSEKTPPKVRRMNAGSMAKKRSYAVPSVATAPTAGPAAVQPHPRGRRRAAVRQKLLGQSMRRVFTSTSSPAYCRSVPPTPMNRGPVGRASASR